MNTRFRWWDVTGLGVVAVYAVMAVQNFGDRRFATGALISATAAVLLAGLALWRVARRTGTALTVIGALPGILAWWTIIGPACGIATIVGALRATAARTAADATP